MPDQEINPRALRKKLIDQQYLAFESFLSPFPRKMNEKNIQIYMTA
jgi:hypothetical protein